MLPCHAFEFYDGKQSLNHSLPEEGNAYPHVQWLYSMKAWIQLPEVCSQALGAFGIRMEQCLVSLLSRTAKNPHLYPIFYALSISVGATHVAS